MCIKYAARVAQHMLSLPLLPACLHAAAAAPCLPDAAIMICALQGLANWSLPGLCCVFPLYKMTFVHQ